MYYLVLHERKEVYMEAENTLAKNLTSAGKKLLTIMSVKDYLQIK